MTKFLPLAFSAFLATGAHAATVHEKTPVAAVAETSPNRPVPGIVLIGMAVSGLAIVGAASRRRQPGRRVTS